MSEFTKAVMLGDYQGDLSFSFYPNEMEYWFKRLGIVKAREQMHEQLERAIDRAVASYDPTKE